MTLENHYFNASDPLHPYTHSAPASPGTFPPSNALRGESPVDAEGKSLQPGKWPCEKNGKWVYAEDHRGEEGYVDGKPHTIKDLGKRPKGWSKDPPPPTPEEAQEAAKNQFTAAIDGYMNDFARERGYDSMQSAASYDGDEDPQFNLEGAYCKQMRSRIYRAAWGIYADVMSGQRPMPVLEEVLAELPPLRWPDAV